MMNLTVKLFARARDLVGREEISIKLPEGAIVADLKSALAEQFPELAPIAGTLLFAIDEHYAGDDTVIGHQSTLACFPPVSGG